MTCAILLTYAINFINYALHETLSVSIAALLTLFISAIFIVTHETLEQDCIQLSGIGLMRKIACAIDDFDEWIFTIFRALDGTLEIEIFVFCSENYDARTPGDLNNWLVAHFMVTLATYRTQKDGDMR